MVEENKKIINEIITQRRLPYSIELIEVDGDKYTVRNNFGGIIRFIKKGENYILDEE